MPEESGGSPTPPLPDRAASTQGENGASNNERRGRRNRRRQQGGPTTTRFQGACEDLKEHVFDSSSSKPSAELFTKTVKAIAEFVAREYSGAGEFLPGLVDLALPTLDPPADPDVNNPLELEMWKLDLKDHRKKVDDRERNMEKVYALILEQCSPTIRDRIEAAATWTTINSTSDAIGLLELIRQSLYQRATRRKASHALVEAETALMKFRQTEKMTNSDYLEKVRELADMFEYLGGELGPSQARVDALLADPDTATDEEKEAAKATAREEYLAVILLTKSDPKRYAALVNDIENGHSRGRDDYPTTLAGAYDMLVNYKSPHQAVRLQHQETGIAFVQEDNEDDTTRNRTSNPGGRGGGRGGGRTGRGGRGRGQRDQTHHSQAEDNLDLNSDSYFEGPQDGHLYVGSSYSMPEKCILLDSCSSGNLIADRSLLHDIHTVDWPLTVHCNAGKVQLNQMGYFGSYPEPVWFNPNGIANILSLHNVAKYHQLTMDTGQANTIRLHLTDGTTMDFTPTAKGLYHYPLDTATEKDMWVLVTTVAAQADKYTHRAVMRAKAARKFQNIIMRPGVRQLMDVAIRHIKGCPITRGDIQAAEDIYGPNLGALKGKTVARPNPHVKTGIDPVPPEIIHLHNSVTLAIDIMFVNRVPFFITISRNLKFGTVEALSNRKAVTITEKLKSVVKLYQHRGFQVTTILADPEFEPIRASFPSLNCCGADEHVPEIERYIRTVKDRTRSTYRMLPFRRIPRLMLIHMVKNAVFWLNALPAQDGVSSDHSPRYLMTGYELDYNLHVRLEFGQYVQTHEEHSNAMSEQTMGAICLGPNGNQQGGHWFLSLATGQRITRHRWTELPMPQEVIQRVNQLGREQKMPRTLTFADRHGRELEDRLVDLEEDDDGSDADYDPADDDSDADDDDDDLSYFSDADDDDDGNMPPLVPNQEYMPANEFDNDVPQVGADNDSLGSYDVSESSVSEGDGSEGMNDDESLHDSNPGGNTGVDPVENTGVDPEENTGVSEIPVPREPDHTEEPVKMTEEEQFEEAESIGRANAADEQATRPHRTNRGPRLDPDFRYLNILSDMDPEAIFSFLMGDDADDMLTFLTEQMTVKKGLKLFGAAGADALKRELEQLIYRKVMKGRHPKDLTTAQKKAALRYLMFLKQKRCGKIKGRGCADGRKQRLYKTKDETSSPTISTEALFLTCMIDALERRCIVTCDIPGAFMHADIDELIHLKLEGEIAELLLKVDPSYGAFVSTENGKTVIYAELSKALYGTLQAALLFWQNLTKFLTEQLGFEVNPYDWCVCNKMIDGKQCTIGWYIDDLKISHAHEEVVESILTALQEQYGKEAPLVVHRGHKQDYLGMDIDFSVPGRVTFNMTKYLERLLDETPDTLMTGSSTSPAANHLFNVNPASPKLDTAEAILFHHLVAKLLYLAKRSRPDVLLAVSFLCTRVQEPDEDDMKKLGRCLRYLRDTKHLSLTLEADAPLVIRWWVDASFAVHPNCRSHTGAAMSLGKGVAYSMSSEQKINTRSSTEAELVGVNDAMGMILWLRHFLEAQVYTVQDNLLFQDNESSIRLEKNGRQSSGKQTKHIEVRYFFITDNIKRNKVKVTHCPTGDMLGDFFTKPLQGSQFRRFRNEILNVTGSAEFSAPSGEETLRQTSLARAVSVCPRDRSRFCHQKLGPLRFVNKILNLNDRHIVLPKASETKKWLQGGEGEILRLAN